MPGTEHPIIQGPFGAGFATPRLVAAVSNAGGLGSYGANHLSPEAILQTAAEIRALTSKPFSMNLWVSNRDFVTVPGDAEIEQGLARLEPYRRELGLPALTPVRRTVYNFEDQARAVIEARPAAFSFIFGIPSADILLECRERGIITIGSATTLDEARALEAARVDRIVASGMEAGGHRPSFVERAEDSLVGTLSLTRQLAAAVRVPVIAAGGIADGPGVAAALRLGAQAAQVGTAFLACEESGAPALHRSLLFEPAARRTVLTRAHTGRLARAIRNRIHDDLKDVPALPYPVQGWVISSIREAALAQGRTDLVTLWSGQSAGLLTRRTVAELMPTLVDGAH